MKLSSEAEEFARLRAGMGWTQAEMAQKLGLTQGYISQVERGESGVEERTLKLLRWTVNLEKPELMEREGARRGKNVISLIEPGGGGKEPADGELKETVEKLGELCQSVCGTRKRGVGGSKHPNQNGHLVARTT